MSKASRPAETELQRLLDRVNITPQQLLHFHTRDVAATPDLFDPTLHRTGDRFGTPLRSWRLNPETLHGRLQAKFTSLNVGFCYQLTHQGRTLFKDVGHAARIETPELLLVGFTIPAIPRISWDYDVPTNLCSVSKLITAIALDLLLRERRIDPDEPVANHLPTYWKPDPSTAGVTFHNLLRHESGLGGSFMGSGAGDYASALSEMRQALSGPQGTAVYKNVNYAILRVTFPIVAGAISRDFSIGAAFDNSIWDIVTATFYRDFVNDRVFAPANLGPFDFKAGPNAARAYPTPPVAPGAILFDVTNNAGASGWHMNMDELMKVMAEFRHGGGIMSRRKAQQLQQNLYGVDEFQATNAGTIYAKRGRFNDNGPNTLDTAIYCIPGNFELGVFINSGPGAGAAQPSYNDDIMQHIVNSVEAI